MDAGGLGSGLSRADLAVPYTQYSLDNVDVRSRMVFASSEAGVGPDPTATSLPLSHTSRGCSPPGCSVGQAKGRAGGCSQ